MIGILQKIKRIVSIVIYNIFKIFTKVKEKKILMISTSKNRISVNLQYIYDYIKDNKKDYDVYVYYKTNGFFNQFKKHILLLKDIATANFILIDDFFPLIYALKIRKGVKHIQVWHALGAFKRVGYSRLGKIGGPSEKSLTHKNYTDAIVSSEAIIPNYAEAFSMSKNDVHALGVPRTDLFFNKDAIETIKSKLIDKLCINDKKVILFAPTFRGNGVKTAHYPEELIDFDYIYKELKNNYICLIKYHPFIQNKNKEIFEKYSDFYIDMNSYSDINELLTITDVLITDYSSVIFDYSLLGVKNLIFHIPDYDSYVDSRDFYYDFSEYMYGETTYSTNELVKKIKSSKIDKKVYNAFKAKFLSAIDGNSTSRIVDYFLD